MHGCTSVNHMLLLLLCATSVSRESVAPTQGWTAAGHLNQRSEVIVLPLWGIFATSAWVGPHHICDRLGSPKNRWRCSMWQGGGCYEVRTAKLVEVSQSWEVSPSHGGMGQSKRLPLRPSPLPWSSGPVRDGSTMEICFYYFHLLLADSSRLGRVPHRSAGDCWSRMSTWPMPFLWPNQQCQSTEELSVMTIWIPKIKLRQTLRWRSVTCRRVECLLTVHFVAMSLCSLLVSDMSSSAWWSDASLESSLTAWRFFSGNSDVWSAAHTNTHYVLMAMFQVNLG